MNRLLLSLLATLGALALTPAVAHAAPWSRAQRAALLAHVRPARVLADTDGNGVFDNLEAELASWRGDTPLDVIVRSKPGHGELSAWLGSRTVRSLTSDGSAAARLTAA